jgi:hypothetical protein
LELGDKLVHEFGLDDSVNTAGRWMSHYLAEMIIEARKSVGAKRATAETKASDLILKIWAQREVMPGHAYPLKRLVPVLKLLEILDSEASPFSPAQGDEFERLLAKAYGQLRGLVALGCLLKYTDIEPAPESGVAKKFLSEDESRVLEVLTRWLDDFDRRRRKSVVRVVVLPEGEQAVDDEQEDLPRNVKARRALQRDIDSLMETLVQLRMAADADTPTPK